MPAPKQVLYEGTPNQIRKQQEAVKALVYLRRMDCAVANLEPMLWREMNRLAEMCSTVYVPGWEDEA